MSSRRRFLQHAGRGGRYAGVALAIGVELPEVARQLAPFPREVLDAVFAASQDLHADLDARNPRWRRIHADYRHFLADQVQWRATVEAHYNAYIRTLDL